MNKFLTFHNHFYIIYFRYVALQQLSYTQSHCYGENGWAQITSDDGITFKYKKSNKNKTSTNSDTFGQLPEILYRKK